MKGYHYEAFRWNEARVNGPPARKGYGPKSFQNEQVGNRDVMEFCQI